MAELVIRGGTVVDPAGGRRADVAIDGGVIVAVGAGLDGRRVLDAGGCVVGPGLVDLNCSVGQPGFEELETVHTAARAAALGGYTTIVARADTDPVIDNAAMVREVLALGAGACCELRCAAALTVGSAGSRLVPMAELAALGVRLFVDDKTGARSVRLLRRALEYAHDLGVVVGDHAEDPELAAGGHLHEGPWSSRLGIAGIPSEAEEVAVMRDLALARLTGGKLHLRHLSTSASLAMVGAARRGGVPVTSEVALANALLTDEACAGFDPATKFRPPLRPAEDRDAVVEAVRTGAVDALVSDHTPTSDEDKHQPFDLAAAGAVSLQWVLALAATASGLPLAALWAALSRGPAAVLCPAGGPSGRLDVGARADVTVFDPTETWVLDPTAGASKGRSTPFAGTGLRGRVRHTILRGEPVVMDAEAQR